MNTKRNFIFAGDINSPYKQFCATLNIFVLFTVTRSSKMQIEGVAAFPLKQWLCYTYNVYPFKHVIGENTVS